MMKVYRITSPQFAKDLSGEGARRFGGRWNSKGINMLYTSSSIALAFLEILVHTDRKYLHKVYSIIELEVDASSGMTVGSADLTGNWNTYPMGEETQQLGDWFVTEGTHLWMSVPSVVVPFEKNYIINPSHKDFKSSVKILNVFEFSPDGRLSN